MKQEDKWKVDAGTQWRMPDTALKKTHQVNTGMLEKDLLREDYLKKKKLMLMSTLYAGRKLF